MSSSAWESTSLSISPLVEVMDAREPRRSLPPRKGSSADEAEGEGGSGGMPSRRVLARCDHAERAIARSVLELSASCSSRLQEVEIEAYRGAWNMDWGTERCDKSREAQVLSFQGFSSTGRA